MFKLKSSSRVWIFGVICMIFIVVSVLMYVASTYFVQAEFSKIENRDVQNQTAVAVNALQNRINQMAVKNSDWASWDDSYQFIVDRNEAYIQANLINQSLSTLNINFMLFYNSAHKLVWAQGADAQNNTLTIPPQLLAYFDSNGGLFCDKVADLKTGVINLPANPLMFAARPILRSDETGPSRGTLVFAEYLSKSEILGLANLTHLDVNYYRLKQLPAGVAPAVPVSDKEATDQVLSQNQIAGYQVVNDYFGKPLLLVRVLESRTVFQEARRSLLYFLGCISLVTLLSIAVAFYIARQVQARDKTIQLKNEFFSIASHEIRTPLTAIRGNSALLQQVYGDKNDQDFAELVSDIRESSNRLIRLVTNFLDVARLEQGKIPLSSSKVMLNEVIASVVDEMQGLAADHKIYIRADIPADLPVVWADPDRIKQVVYNIIGNAAKFTETGGITVTAAAQGNYARVFIKDTGRGIPPDGQKLLFRKFQQTRSADAVSGSGLGLYISKMLVNLVGGQINLDSSAVGKGTTISFTVPIATAAQLAASQDQ